MDHGTRSTAPAGCTTMRTPVVAFMLARHTATARRCLNYCSSLYLTIAVSISFLGCNPKNEADVAEQRQSGRPSSKNDQIASFLPQSSGSKEDIDRAMTNIVNATKDLITRYGMPVDWALNAAKTNSEPKQLREWALKLLANSRDLGVDACATVSELPDFVIRLHPWGGVPIVLVYPLGLTPLANCVQLTWGGGFVKYGLLIGGEEFRPPSNWITKEWVPGIYGWQTSD